MKDQMDRERILNFIKTTESVTRRRLYFTMLGVCGKDEDIKLLEDLIKSGNRKKRAGLDALIACYLTLNGDDGVDLIEKTFLADHEVDYVDTLAAVSALRFHGTEVEILSKDRIVKAVRHLLDRPKMADMIIPDLARWEDWSVMERLVKMFKEADEESNWLRVPVVTYLRACPKPEAKGYIEELRKIDPEAVQRADFFLGVGDGDDDWDDEPADGESKAEPADKKPGSDGSDKSDSTEEGTTQSEPDAESSKKLEGKKDQASRVSYVVKNFPIGQEQQQTFATANDVANHLNGTAEGTTTIAASATTKNALEPAPEANFAPEPNSSPTEFVSTMAEPMSASPAPVVSPAVTPTPPVAAAAPSLTWSIIFIPMAVSAAIFLLLWSIVNGWFERLIF
jgi:hypothetical protein